MGSSLSSTAVLPEVPVWPSLNWAGFIQYNGGTIDDFCNLYTACDNFPKPHHKARARSSVVACSDAYGLALRRFYHIPIVHDKFKIEVKMWVRQTLRNWSTHLPRWASFVKERTMLTVTADRSWGSELVNVQKISRGMDYSFLLGIDASSLQSISAGSDMLRLPFNSRQPVPQDWSSATCDQNQLCTRWASDLGRRIALRARPCWCYSWPAASEIDTSAAAENAEQQFIQAGLSYQEPVVTVEDKDPSVLWVCESQQLFGRWIYMLSTQPRWAIHTLDVAALVTFYRNLLDTCLPRSMLPKNMAFSRQHPLTHILLSSGSVTMAHPAKVPRKHARNHSTRVCETLCLSSAYQDVPHSKLWAGSTSTFSSPFKRVVCTQYGHRTPRVENQLRCYFTQGSQWSLLRGLRVLWCKNVYSWCLHS